MTSNRSSEWEPRVALIVALVATLGAVTIPSGHWIELFLFAAAMVAAGLALRISPRLIARKLFHALPFLLLIAITVPLSVPGKALVDLGLGLAITVEGLELGASILIKATLAIVILGGLIIRVPPEQMLAGLRGLKCPSSLVMILGSLMRFFPLIGTEWSRMRRSAWARAPRSGRLWREGRVMSQMAAVLLVRSLDRSERIHRAMVARGFDGVAVVSNERRLAVHDWLLMAMGLLAVICLRLGGMIVA